jgi:hypothetical protein
MMRVIGVLLAALTAFGCASNREERDAAMSCASTWYMVYRHDADGKPIAGTKSALFDAIRSGAPIRFAWGMKIERSGATHSVEHSAEPIFLTIVGGKEVVVQLPEHIAQRSYVDLSGAVFESPAVMWRGLMSTDGTFDAVWVNRATGEEVRRVPQRVGLAWFAFLPPSRCSGQLPIELAVPSGVRRADK